MTYANFQEHKGVWTREHTKALKTADVVVLRFSQILDAPMYNSGAKWVEMTIKQRTKEGAPEQSLCSMFKGHVQGGYLDELDPSRRNDRVSEFSREPSNIYKPKDGVWVLSVYSNQQCHVSSVLKSIPIGAEVRFNVLLDDRTTPNMALRGFHGDLLEVESITERSKLKFNLDISVGLSSSGRFGT